LVKELSSYMNLFDILMFVFTFFIAWGTIRSLKNKNKFAVGFGLVSLAVFLFSDALIIYYATQVK
jgi:hypothetical protein